MLPEVPIFVWGRLTENSKPSKPGSMLGGAFSPETGGRRGDGGRRTREQEFPPLPLGSSRLGVWDLQRGLT